MNNLNNILSFEDYINEGLWKKGFERSKSGEERLEDILGDHSFTDGNGKFHKHGIKPKNNTFNIANNIIKIVTHKELYKTNDIIDLNIIDMSEVTSITSLFECVFNNLKKIDEKINWYDIKFDTSGWVLNNCIDFEYGLTDIIHDIGVENWKVNSEKVKLNAFDNSYYMDNLPSWFLFDIKDYIKLCANHLSYNKFGVDKELTKKLGKKSYWIIFNENVNLQFIPENVNIKEINNSKSRICRINVNKLKSLKGLPKEFIPYNGNGCYVLSVNLNNIIDEKIIIPKGIRLLNISEDDDITKLPKEIDCSINLYNKNQLGHIEKVNGNFNCGNSSLSSLVGCPKKVTGDFDAHNSQITDLIGSPEHVGGDFTCSNNGRLKSLKGCPKIIDGDFEFFSTGITNIDDFPEHVGGEIEMSGCTHLENFIGLPEIVNGNLDICYCNVKSLEGLPKEIKGKLCIKKLTINNKPVTVDDILKISPNLTTIVEGKYDTTNLVH